MIRNDIGPFICVSALLVTSIVIAILGIYLHQKIFGDRDNDEIVRDIIESCDNGKTKHKECVQSFDSIDKICKKDSDLHTYCFSEWRDDYR